PPGPTGLVRRTPRCVSGYAGLAPGFRQESPCRGPPAPEPLALAVGRPGGAGARRLRRPGARVRGRPPGPPDPRPRRPAPIPGNLAADGRGPPVPHPGRPPRPPAL